MIQVRTVLQPIAYASLLIFNLLCNANGENIIHNVGGITRCAQEEEEVDTQLSQNVHKCLSIENELDGLVKSAKMIYITMPAKVAGTSFTLFTHDYCLKNYTFPPGNYFSVKEQMRDLITANYDIPPIISSHIGLNNTLTDLVKGVTADSLIIYIHRKEDERLLSAIRQVAGRICDKRFTPQLEGYKRAAIHSKNRCILREEPLHNLIIEKKLEIGNSGPRVLNCNFYNAVQENKPKIVFLNYKQADRLQFVLAKHKCPELLERNKLPIHFDDPKHWKQEIYIKRLRAKKDKIPLTEWLADRKNVLGWAFNLKNEASCVGKVNAMEEAMKKCEDETLQLDLITRFKI